MNSCDDHKACDNHQSGLKISAELSGEFHVFAHRFTQSTENEGKLA